MDEPEYREIPVGNRVYFVPAEYFLDHHTPHEWDLLISGCRNVPVERADDGGEKRE